MRLIDADKIKLPQGFFEKVDNVPKFYEWLDEQPTVDAEPVRHVHWISNDNSTYLRSECQTRILNEQHSIEIRRWCMIFGAIQLISWVLLVLACTL